MTKLFALPAIVLCFLVFSCGPKEKPVEQKVEEKPDLFINHEDGSKYMFILREQTTDFEGWYNIFKNDDLKLYQEEFDDVSVHQGIEDETLVMISGYFTDEEKARTFFDNRSKEPNMLRVSWSGMELPKADQAFFVFQQIGDYITWQEKFEEDEVRRRDNGLFCINVARDIDDPTKVINYFAIGDVEKALAFINPELTKVIESAGVQGKPELFAVTVIRTSEQN